MKQDDEKRKKEAEQERIEKLKQENRVKYECKWQILRCIVMSSVIYAYLQDLC